MSFPCPAVRPTKTQVRIVLILFSLLCLFNVSGKAQVVKDHTDYWDIEKKALSDTSKNEIDPRRYVQVLYKKNQNYRKKERSDVQRVIWKWDSSGFYQKYKVLDNEGFVEVYFQKEELARNFNFQGNISLAATIKGKDGERKIEVEPYSLVGEDRKEIGIESFTATTVAQLLFNTIIEMKRTIVSVDFNKYNDFFLYQEDARTLASTIKNIKEYGDRLKEKVDPTDNNFLALKRYIPDSFYVSLMKYKNPTLYSYSQLVKDIEFASVELNSYSPAQGDNLKKDFIFLLNRVALINNYLGAFEKAGPDAVKAFLEIASKDKINFKFLRDRLQDEQAKLINIISDSKISGDANLLLASRNSLDHAIEIVKILNTFSSIEGSAMHKIVKGYIKDRDVMAGSKGVRLELEEENGKIPYKNFTDYFDKITDDSIVYNKYSRYILLRLLERSPSFEQFKKELSVLAAQIMYRKLVYATINLAKSGAQPGDVLYLNVVWKNIDGQNDSTEKRSSLLNIGTYHLKETGWKTKITESFYLVERINEPSEDVDPQVSTSNFKGAYGASIMRTFYYNEGYQRNFGGQLMNFLQPSLGFNVSYLDFYKNKDIEIGTGLQLGLFRNVFFFGSGINLHSIRKEQKKSAAYFMFGISFTNIAAKFKDGDKAVE